MEGYISYGYQIGSATGYVQEFYHEGFLAKRMELGALVAAAPKDWVVRKKPEKEIWYFLLEVEPVEMV